MDFVKVVPSGEPFPDEMRREEVEEYRLSPANDAFGRARVGLPATLFASSHEYDASPLIWQSKLAGSASATFIPNEASVDMVVTASGDSAIRQTYRYFRYLPGKSQLCLLTAVVGAAATNVRKRWGYFDASNGLYFEQSGSAVAVGRRTNVTGTPVDTTVLQSAWNLDKMDGTGPSGHVLDLSKANIFVIDFEWLGVGRQRFGVNIDGFTHYVHEIKWANANTGVYMSTANLPVRYEIAAIGAITGGNKTMKQICSTVVSEGGSDAEMQARVRSANNGVTAVSASTRRPVLSIRPKATFNSIVNRAQIEPVAVEFINTGSAVVEIELVRNGTVGGSPVWNSAGTTSTVEFDVAGNAISGGEVLWSGYIASANQGGKLQIPFEDLTNADIPLHLDIDGNNPTALSVVVTSVGAACNVLAGITWREIY